MTDSKALQKWADKAMFEAAPIKRDASGQVRPTVTLLWMTPDPLGAIAATCMMYEGKVVYDLADVTDEDRRHYWQQVERTHLKAPLEFVQFHFLIEGVTRAFTHQMVRQRTATYAQESMRFAVKENMAEEVPLPPSLAGLPEDDDRVARWRITMDTVQESYNALVNAGVPAEDARGLLPHSTTTRLHYRTDLRSLLDHAGNRLCTQAQFEWRIVFMEIVQAIRQHAEVSMRSTGAGGTWQGETIGDLFRPVCYQLGHCPFTATFDRACSIRDRVQDNAQQGIPSSKWGPEAPIWNGTRGTIADKSIRPEEWLLDHGAARVQG